MYVSALPLRCHRCQAAGCNENIDIAPGMTAIESDVILSLVAWLDDSIYVVCVLLVIAWASTSNIKYAFTG